jgi:hypothetical protein
MTWRSIKDDPPPKDGVFIVSDGITAAAAMMYYDDIMHFTGKTEDGYMGDAAGSLGRRMSWETPWEKWQPLPDA